MDASLKIYKKKIAGENVNLNIPTIDKAVDLEEIEKIAIEKLDINSLSYYISSANDGITLKRNKSIFDKILINPKLFSDISEINITTTIIGKYFVSMPILIAPTAMHKLANKNAELETAIAANYADTVMILSSLSSTSIEEVAIANGNGIRWLQLYILRDRNQTIELVRKAEKYGYSALVLTVDAPVPGTRELSIKTEFKPPSHVNLPNFESFLRKQSPTNSNIKINPKETNESSNSFKFIAQNFDSSLSWDILDWLKNITNLPIILKGIHRVDDALYAQRKGVEAIIVSNHGGRQLDSVPSTLEMLYYISRSLKNVPKNKMEVYVDGGFTKGSDVFKALALGAKSVLLGRPILWGLASGGKNGVLKVINLIKNELLKVMRFSGCKDIEMINENLLIINNFTKL